MNEELAERIEAAEGADRALDVAIALATGGVNAIGNDILWPSGFRLPCPCYTVSIDAALTLVPEGWDSVRIGRLDDGAGYAQLAGNDGHMMNEYLDDFYVEADAATPALALCAAALRARQ